MNDDHDSEAGPDVTVPALDRLASGGLTRRQALLLLGGGAFAAVLGDTWTSATAQRADRRAAASTAPAYRVPVEHAHHTRTWMAWPDSYSIWGHALLPAIQADIALIARTIARHEPVVMCANRGSVSKAHYRCGSRVKVIASIPVNDCWMRDTGPIFHTDRRGGLKAVGLNFNGWGERQEHSRDELVARRIAARLGVPFARAGFVGEGGAIETDGHGTLLATKSSLVNANRNPDMTQAEIEAAMCRAYGAAKVIWCTGVRNQDITDDHIDGTSRFIGDHRTLVQIPQPGDTDVWANDAREQLATLQAASDAHGDPVGVTTIQGPDYTKIRQAANPDFLASYANYYVCNGAVIMQNTGDAAADGAARATLAAVFPRRKVVSLNIDNLAAWGGGIHCVTMQQPAAATP